MKNVFWGFVAAVFIVGCIALGNGALQLRQDYRDFTNMRSWVAQMQAAQRKQAEERAKQQQSRVGQPTMAPAPNPPPDAPEK